MKITVRRPIEIEVDSVRLVLPVNYGEEDIPNDFPGRSGDQLTMDIDIATGKISGWPAGKAFDLHMKVVDGGCYYLMQGAGSVGGIEGDYVPKCIPGSYGDYVELKIDESGVITNWKPKADFAALLRDTDD